MPHTLPSYRRFCSDEQLQHSAQCTSETCSPTCSPTCNNTSIPCSVPVQAQRLHIVVDSSGSYQYREHQISAYKHIQTQAPKPAIESQLDLSNQLLPVVSLAMQSRSSNRDKCQVPNFIDTSWTLSSDMLKKTTKCIPVCCPCTVFRARHSKPSNKGESRVGASTPNAQKQGHHSNSLNLFDSLFTRHLSRDCLALGNFQVSCPVESAVGFRKCSFAGPCWAQDKACAPLLDGAERDRRLRDLKLEFFSFVHAVQNNTHRCQKVSSSKILSKAPTESLPPIEPQQPKCCPFRLSKAESKINRQQAASVIVVVSIRTNCQQVANHGLSWTSHIRYVRETTLPIFQSPRPWI